MKRIQKDGKEYLERLGARIKVAREQLGISQEKFAGGCGFDRTYISLVERGRRNLSIVNLGRIAKALQVDLGTLVDKL